MLGSKKHIHGHGITWRTETKIFTTVGHQRMSLNYPSSVRHLKNKTQHLACQTQVLECLRSEEHLGVLVLYRIGRKPHSEPLDSEGEKKHGRLLTIQKVLEYQQAKCKSNRQTNTQNIYISVGAGCFQESNEGRST